jgi:hypothetical protein
MRQSQQYKKYFPEDLGLGYYSFDLNLNLKCSLRLQDHLSLIPLFHYLILIYFLFRFQYLETVHKILYLVNYILDYHELVDVSIRKN